MAEIRGVKERLAGVEGREAPAVVPPTGENHQGANRRVHEGLRR